MSLDPTKQYFTKYTNEKLGSGFTGSNSGTTVTETLGGLKLLKITQEEYDNLEYKDSQTVYFIID